MSSIIEEDVYCKNLKTIPQFVESCWLNSILTVSLYSQRLRKVLIKHFKNKKKSLQDKLLNFLLYMLKNNNNIRDYKDFRPELLFISYLNANDHYLKLKIKKEIPIYGFKNYESLIKNIYSSYNIPFIDLSYNNSNLYYSENYLKINKDNFERILDNTDIIIIEKDKDLLFSNDENNFNIFKDKIGNYKELIDNINKNNSIITINNHTYILDCCIISNYNELTHVISGITCNNKKYLIDSIQTKRNIEFKSKNKIKINYNPCKPYLYDWLLNPKFCLDIPNCKITNNEKNNLCYDLNNSVVMLIYVKEKSSSLISNEVFNESNISYKDFNFSKKSVSLKINDMYSELYNSDYDELYERLLYCDYIEHDLLYMKNIRANYGFFYEKMLKKPISKFTNKNNDELFKELSIAIIFKYLKKGIVYRLDKYTDANTIYKIIPFYSNKSIDYYEKYLNDNFDYDRTYRDMIDNNLKEIYNNLFKENEDFFDGHIKHRNPSDIKKQVLVKLLIGSQFLKRNYKKIIVNINHKKIYGKSPKSRSSSN